MRVLGISDGCNLYTGFGTQAFSVLSGFQNKGCEVEQLGWWVKEQIVHNGIKINPMGEYGDLNLVIQNCNRFKPDIIWSLGDLHMIEYMLQAPEEIKKRWVHWLPIDAEPFPVAMEEVYKQIPHLVLMSQFAKDMSEKKLPKAHMIPHGVDPNVFKPVINRNQIRMKNQIDKKFVVVFVAKNQWRKNLDLAIESFARFSKNKDDVVFIMHTTHMSSPKLRGWFLPFVLKIYKDEFDPKLPEKIRISAQQMHEHYMNIQYNASDVFLLTSAGEGFGIPCVEAQMSGLPIIVPDFTTGREFVLPDGNEANRTGELINIAVYQIQTDAGVKRALIDPKDAAEKLEKFYASWKTNKLMLKKYAENGRRTALERYNIKDIVDRWYHLVCDINKQIGSDYIPTENSETVEFDVNQPLILEEI